MRSRWIFSLLLLSACASDSGPKADWVLRNGAVYTVDANRSWAQSLAIGGGAILYVGDDSGVEPFVGPESEVIELGGKMVLPGFIDSHSHPSGALISAVAVDLSEARTLEDYLEGVRSFAEAHPEKKAIRGAGWSNALFPVTGPKKEDLDAVVSDRPVALTSGDWHSSWVNSNALELAGISMDTEAPEGGVIERDPKTGEPTGTLRESAMGLVSSALPPFTLEERITGLERFQEMAAKDGLTTVRVAAIGLAAVGDVDLSELQAYERLESEGKLRVRFRGTLLLPPDAPPERIQELAAEREKQKGGLFEIDAVKIFIDGVVEGETAYLLEPYAHRPDYRGELLWEPGRLNEMVAAADREGFIVHVHAIGDAATGVALDAFEFAREKNGPRDARHQVTHLQLVAPSDVKRFASLSAIGVPQPFWFTKGGFYEAIERPYLGEERASREYPMKSFFDAGATVASASDFPVTSPFSPVRGMKMGITRSSNPANPDMVLGPEERVSLEQMIESFTRNGAFAAKLQDRVGTLEVGKQADVVVLDRNLFDVPPEQVGDAKVLLTLFEGRPTYRAPEL
jgi:hypothetical protein